MGINEADLSGAKIEKQLRLTGDGCRCPLIDTREAFVSLAPGQVLEIITDQSPTAMDSIPSFCGTKNCSFQVSQDGELWRVRIEKSENDTQQWSNIDPRLRIKGVSKQFIGSNRQVHALENINVEISEGEFICIVGPSGCGKSTLLNIIAGLNQPDQGEIQVDGEKVTAPSNNRAMIFQEHALFPWLNVRKNIEFGLKIKGVPKQEREQRVQQFLRMVHLSKFADSYIHELSGGMRQRVALARALAINPDMLLMDEPFAALDAQTRGILHIELQEIWVATHKTIVFVTHNVREAVCLADRILLMSARPGKIKREYQVNLKRPRDDNDVKVAQIASGIMDELRDEIEKVAKEEKSDAAIS